MNPAHLFLGTPLHNARDRESKGRGAPGRGAAHGAAKLDAGDVSRILELHAQGVSQTAIARELGVSQPHVSRIVRGDHWTLR